MQSNEEENKKEAIQGGKKSQKGKSKSTTLLKVRGYIDANHLLAIKTKASEKGDEIQMVVVPARRGARKNRLEASQ